MSDSSLPPAAVGLAARMYDAARAGQMDIFEQALPAGLPANMTNEKGDSLVSIFFLLIFKLEKLSLHTKKTTSFLITKRYLINT